MKKICFVGFMGSGKTSVGKALAEHLHEKWVDLDEYIVNKKGKTISHIFQEEGEVAFRNIESQCLEELLYSEYHIISTGGGVITSPSNVERLKQVETIYLEYPFDILYERIKGDTTRPLVTTYEALHKRFLDRQALYEAASSLSIACEGKSINAIVEEIIRKLK